nr:zinc finger, CCHC-type [Tanacetum cinerariifolium]
MHKSNKYKNSTNNPKRIARISVRACCFANPRPVYPPYQLLSPPTDYQTVPSSTPNFSPPLSQITSPGISPSKLLTTPKSTLPHLASHPPTPTQPSKHSSPLAINLDPIELIFLTPHTSPHAFFDSLEDLPHITINPPPPRPSFESIECLENQPPPLPSIEPPLPLLPLQLPPQLPPLGPKKPSPMLTHEMFCDHCQRTQVIVDTLRNEMRFNATFDNEILESFNSRVLEARGKPIITMLEDIRVYIMHRIWCMIKLAFDNKDSITPSVRRQMEYNKKIHSQLPPLPPIERKMRGGLKRRIRHLTGDEDHAVTRHATSHCYTSSLNTMPPPSTPSSSNTMQPPPTPSTSNTMPPPSTPSTLNTMPPPPTPSGSNTMPSHATPVLLAAKAVLVVVSGVVLGMVQPTKVVREEHQFKMDVVAMYEMKREQITNNEDGQFWEDCARKFDIVKEHRAQDNGFQARETNLDAILGKRIKTDARKPHDQPKDHVFNYRVIKGSNLTSMSVVYVLNTLILEDGGDDAIVEQTKKRAKWDNDDYVCIGLILRGMSDYLFDIYQNIKSSKEPWDSLKAKYMAEDASSKKFIVSNFTNYKMMDSRPVMEQYNKLLGILGRFTQHKMKMDEAIQANTYDSSSSSPTVFMATKTDTKDPEISIPSPNRQQSLLLSSPQAPPRGTN